MKLRLVLFALAAALIFALGVLARPWIGAVLSSAHLRVVAWNDRGGPIDAAHYARKTDLYAQMKEARPIIFLGDSRVEWGDWAELFGRCDISNRGISGDTTAGVLERVRVSVPNDNALCVMQVGVNDLLHGVGPEAVVRNYQGILEFLVREKHARVVVTPIILVTADWADLNRAITETNRQLASLASTAGAEWVDVNASLAPSGFLTPDCRADEVHLNGYGYKLMRDALLPYLSSAPGP